MIKQFIFRIFAIVAGTKVFVGKTTSGDTKPILYRHSRGEYKTTRNHFHRNSGTNVQLFVLKEIHTDYKTAYRYTIAFIKIFIEAGYEVLNSNGMIEDALDIHELTHNIYLTLQEIPVEEYLNKNGKTTPSEPEKADMHSPPSITRHAEFENALATEKITTRVTPAEKKKFTDLAKKTGVTQRQMLMLLLSDQQHSDWYDVEWSSEEYVRPLLQKYRDKISFLEETNQILQTQLQQSKNASKAETKSREASMREGISAYFNLFSPTVSGRQPISQGYYKEYLNETPNDQRHQYPDNENFFLFFPDAILLGQGRYPARFIIGRDVHGNKVLLRYYPKNYFVGFSFMSPKFGLQGSCWFIRCERAKDGAMDVIFALPMIIGHRAFSPKQEAHSTLDGTVDSLLADARRRATLDDPD